MRFSFLCWGDVGWDDYDDEPQARPGGCALNVACSLVASGATDVACAAPIGEDGLPLRDLLASRGVGVDLLEVGSARTPRQRIRLDPGGERTLCGYTGGALDGYQPGPRVLEAVQQASLAYIPVWSLTQHMAEAAWERAQQVALDLMDLGDLDLDFVKAALHQSQVVFAGLDAKRHRDWIDTLRKLAADPRAALVVVTLGARGARAFSAGPEIHVPAAKVPGGVVVDTTGCGDAFAGAFLAARSRGADVTDSLTAGTARAATVAAHRGAVETPR